MSDPGLLGIYLQDHHAGAVGGLQLARRVAGANEGAEGGAELAKIAEEIAEDLEALERLMDSVGVGPDRRKDAASWAGEKLGRLKRNGTWLAYSPLSRMVELEGLVLGVTGKLGLWEAVAANAASIDVPADVDLDELIARARDQRTRLDALRKLAAAEAFSQ